MNHMYLALEMNFWSKGWQDDDDAACVDRLAWLFHLEANHQPQGRGSIQRGIASFDCTGAACYPVVLMIEHSSSVRKFMLLLGCNWGSNWYLPPVKASGKGQMTRLLLRFTEGTSEDGRKEKSETGHFSCSCLNSFCTIGFLALKFLPIDIAPWNLPNPRIESVSKIPTTTRSRPGSKWMR